MSEQQVVKISVRDMAEFVLRSGSIDSRYTGAKRALEGTRIHQQIQRLRKKQALLNDEIYEKEYSLAHSFLYKDFMFTVEGRVDGVWFKKDGATGATSVTIEEIKSTTKPVDAIENDPGHWHWAQAKCYGFLYAVLNDTESMTVQLTYVQVDSNESVVFEIPFTFEEAEAFFFDIVEKYYVFAKLDYDRINERNETGKNLCFPYEQYRKSQRAFAVAVYKTILQNKKLFAGAPTGTGKTISTLFPSVKALTEGLADKLFYITAKTMTRQAAEEAFALMNAKGLVMRSVTITAKDKICFCKESACNPQECTFADGHFDRVNAAILDIVEHKTAMNRQTIEAYARKHHVCPFEFSFDITLFSDCIICDYNYVYDPKVYMKRFFGDEAKNSDFIVLHDETHNLVDRSREMFSAQLEKSQFAAVRKLCRGKNAGVYRTLGKLKAWFDDISDGDGVSVTKTPPAHLLELLCYFTEKCDKWLADENTEIEDAVLELYFKARDFMRIWEFFDERYVFYVENGRKETVVKLLCLDASYLLSLTQKKLKSAIFFSATLTPMDYFREVLGGSADDFTLNLPTPFKHEHLCLLIDNAISTMYKDRQASYEPIAHRLFQMVSGKVGNYLAFFSSYEYMRQVQDIFMDCYPQVPVLTQTQSMTEQEREAFLECFSKDNDERLLGFTVLGGIFSEGIDLVGERLIGAAIVGVGLPMITPERNVMMDYYKARGMNGFDYAYVFPGMNKVLQAAGRVIRSAEDKGVVLLIDSRFLNSTYKAMMPDEWKHFNRLTGGSMEQTLEHFWT